MDVPEPRGTAHENFAIVFEAIKELLKQEDEPRKKIGFTAREKQAKYGTKPRKRK